MGLLNIVLFAALVATGYAEVAKMADCTESNDEICKVSEVRITPCPRPSTKFCRLRKKTDASISFDFTPNFSTSQLKTMVYWDNGADIPYPNFESDDGCKYTSCPTVAGQTQTLNYTMHIYKKLPTGTFPLKWKVWNEANGAELCCFKATIKLLNEL